MVFRILNPTQAASGRRLTELEFLTCAICENSTVFLLNAEVEMAGRVVGGQIEVDDEASSTLSIVRKAEKQIKSSHAFYPKPVMVDGNLLRCGRCSHPVWHQQDIIAYHRLMNCPGCNQCMMRNYEDLVRACQGCLERNVFPDCDSCHLGDSRKLHGLDVYDTLGISP